MKQVNFFSAIALAVFLCAGSLSFSQEKNPQRKNDAKTTAMQQKIYPAWRPRMSQTRPCGPSTRPCGGWGRSWRN